MKKELKSRILNEYLKGWHNDTRMAEFCTKGIWDAIEVNGLLVVGKKPDLQTDFWFGYSDVGQGLSYEENNIRTERIGNHKDKYFIHKNTEDLNRIIENLTASPFVYVYPKVYGDTPIDLYQLKFAKYNLIEEGERPYRGMNIDYRPLTMDERKIIITMYEAMLDKQIKRIKNYLKRFANCISVNTYWIDR